MGDLHGLPIWKKIVEKEKNSNYFVFLGDYFDNYENTNPSEQFENFADIVRFKYECSKQVYICVGNHDFHHMPFVHEQYSGFRYPTKFIVQDYLKTCVNNGIIQPCFLIDRWLFSHAGLTLHWMASQEIDWNTEDFVDKINELFIAKPKQFYFTPGITGDMYGNDITQGPLWVRPEALVKDGLKKYVQVVGHTKQYNIHATEDSQIILCDTIYDNNNPQYLVIEKNKDIINYKIEKINNIK